MRPPVVKLLAALVALGVVGTIATMTWWDPQRTFDESAPNDAAAGISDEELVRAAGRKVFFGHMSVGKNILSGVDQVYASHGLEPPPTLGVQPGGLPDEEIPAGGDGVVVHALIGENRHPYRKLDNFEASLRAGLASDVDVALIKFCYIDVRWDSDVDRLFTTYRDTMAGLERDYPDVRFIHVTAPLTTGAWGIKDHVKLLVGRDDNANRERYNELMRAHYGPDDLLDVALVESTGADGVRTGELLAGYSSDGAHLNEAGSARVAAEFLRMVAGQE